MRKLLAALTALVLFAMPLGALAEAAASPAMPEAGGVVEGFELIGTRPFNEIDAMVYHFVHQRTGAELFYIANDDTNRVFDLTFHTQAIDNTGLPHVFEHATLAGSAKYPSKELWFNLANGSYNTFMNAMTGQTYTTYPVASLSEAQLLKYADFYTDCCLNPMVMEDESIFREEAWRYRMGSMEDDLTMEGTVYSEMLGVMSLDRMTLYNNRRAAMPGSYYGNISGGDPAFIPDMTFDSLKAYHEMYYHPSNCIAVLYGLLDDYAAFLKLLDDAFAPFEKREFSFDDPGYTPITGPVEAEYAFPVEAGFDTARGSSLAYTIMLPGLRDDPAESLRMNQLASLLKSDASPLSQAMRRALPSAGFDLAFLEDGPEDYMAFMAIQVDPEDGKVFRETIDSALADLAENGFPQDMVDSEMASLKLSSLLTREASGIGANLAPKFVAEYLSTGMPFRLIDLSEGLYDLDRLNREGAFAALAKKWLVGSELTAFTTTRPEPGMKEKQDAELAAKLAEIKANMTQEELDAVIRASNAEDAPNPDTAGMIQDLTAVTVESLPEEYKIYPVSDVTGDDSVRRIDATAGVEGIGQVGIYLDAEGIAQSDLHWFNLFTGLIGRLDTTAHTREELDVLASRYLYAMGSLVDISRLDDGSYHPRLALSWISLDEDLQTGYDLIHELLYDAVYDPTKVLENIQSIRSALKTDINAKAYNPIVRRGLALSSPAMRTSVYLRDLDYYEFLTNAELLFTEHPEEGVSKLEQLRDYFNNSNSAIVTFAGNDASIALNRPIADGFLASLDSRPIERVQYDPPVPERNEALIVDINVQYNSLVASYAEMGVEGYEAPMDVVTALVEDTFLLPMLRDQYGAYGVMHDPTEYDGIYIYTYRDPNVKETFQVYDQLPDLFADLDLDQQTLDRYILSTYSGYALSKGELSGAATAIYDAIEEHGQEEKLDDMRALKAMTPETVKGYVDMYRGLVEKGSRSTAGGASAVNANADLYSVILNPFGAEDLSSQALTDVPEGSDDYDAIRYVFENGYMSAFDDGSFGVNETATVGDISAALYVLLGGAPNAAEEAVSAFAQYGIVWDDAVADEYIDAETCDAILNTFAYTVNADYPGEMVSAADPFTRRDLARALSRFIPWLESLQQDAEAAD